MFPTSLYYPERAFPDVLGWDFWQWSAWQQSDICYPCTRAGWNWSFSAPFWNCCGFSFPCSWTLLQHRLIARKEQNAGGLHRNHLSPGWHLLVFIPCVQKSCSMCQRAGIPGPCVSAPDLWTQSSAHKYTQLSAHFSSDPGTGSDFWILLWTTQILKTMASDKSSARPNWT